MGENFKLVKKIIFLCLIPAFFMFSKPTDFRLGETMLKVNEYRSKKNWIKIINSAHLLYKWGEYLSVKKCLELAAPIVVGKHSYAGAFHIALMYKKVGDFKNLNYWIKVAERLKKPKRRWRKY